MNRFIEFGLRETFRGLRSGSTPLSALGAVAFGYGLVKRLTKPRPEAVYSTTLKPGQSIRIRVDRGEDESLDVTAE